MLEVGHPEGASAWDAGAVHVFTPGVSVGYTYFDVGRDRTFAVSAGASLTSESVPYFRGGGYRPFTGPSEGPYVGAMVRRTF